MPSISDPAGAIISINRHPRPGQHPTSQERLGLPDTSVSTTTSTVPSTDDNADSIASAHRVGPRLNIDISGPG